jgi:hypothetical protein
MRTEVPKDAGEELLRRLEAAWLWIRHRPLIKCPFCQGKGGAMSGYYEPEWSECGECFRFWDDLDDHGWPWFVGRLPVWAWLQSKASIRARLWYRLSFTSLIKCKIGIHRWMNEDRMEPGLRICARCWKDKKVPVGPMEFVHVPGGGMQWVPVGSGFELVAAAAPGEGK